MGVQNVSLSIAIGATQDAPTDAVIFLKEKYITKICIRAAPVSYQAGVRILHRTSQICPPEGWFRLIAQTTQIYDADYNIPYPGEIHLQGYNATAALVEVDCMIETTNDPLREWLQSFLDLLQGMQPMKILPPKAEPESKKD